jgi:hypothetical protein
LIIIAQSYGVNDVTIERRPYGFKNFNIGINNAGLLAYLIRRRFSQSLPTKSPSSICALRDLYVNYIYEYDIYNQDFNSSFQDPNSVVVQRLQSNLADWTSEELYKRNLVSSILAKPRLMKIIDVSEQYNNHSTIRIYTLINLRKNLIPVMRSVFELVFEKLQKQSFSTSQENINWENIVIIPIRK